MRLDRAYLFSAVLCLALMISQSGALPVSSSGSTNSSFDSAQAVVVVLHPLHVLMPASYSSTSPGCSPTALCPSFLEKAYGFDRLQSQGVNGTGQTIVIDDACGDPSISKDLHTFDTAFGLRDPILRIIYPQGKLGVCIDAGWAEETALDVEWAHVVAPGAAIDLLVANQPSPADMYGAWNFSLANGLGNQISNSYGGAGCFQTRYCNATIGQGIGPCTQTNGTQGVNVQAILTFAQSKHVTILAASGDGGYWGVDSPNEEPIPGDCPGVLTVGGTTLRVDSYGNYSGESAWSGSGGGYATKPAEPRYQSNALISDPSRKLAKPDVSAVADPATGVWVFNAGNWKIIGGTSLSCPIWTGFVADVNQVRAVHGFYPAGFLNRFLYSAVYGNAALYQRDFHDVTTGSNGWDAASGWDPATGLGTFIAPALANTLGSNPNA